jgi:iron-sulfur cluster repair protein YtfE (RIC family)
MKHESIESYLNLIRKTQKCLDLNGDWPEVHQEITELLQTIEKELNRELRTQKSSINIEKMISRAMWIIQILLGL